MKKLLSKILLLCGLTFLTTSCTFEQKGTHKRFLNYKYVLREAGDLHGIDPTSGTSVERNSGYSSYKSLFDLKNSYINFQCVGDSFKNYHCETTLVLKNSIGLSILEFATPFDSYFSGGFEYGVVNHNNDELKSSVNTIYAYTPYWVRFQLEYDVKNDGNKILLTFEFWKQSLNDIPMWE